jgi:uracil-DNA glycosylase family 4
MAQDDLYSTDDLRRQVLAHLQSLRLAGVEWLPAAPEADPTFQAQSSSTESHPVRTAEGSLLQDAQQPVFASEPPLEQRRQELRLLAEEVQKCTRCAELACTRTQTVFADGSVGAELCFIGEAPGADEDAQGLPFVGAAGQLLNKIIAACGLKREEVYICNILKCRPPGNRTPLTHEAANCRPFLERQLELVRPKFICALGSSAAQNLLGTTLSIGKLRGRFHDYRGIPVLCTYHPAFLLPHRSPDKKRDVWEDMKMLLARMGRPVPQK